MNRHSSSAMPWWYRTYVRMMVDCLCLLLTMLAAQSFALSASLSYTISVSILFNASVIVLFVYALQGYTPFFLPLETNAKQGRCIFVCESFFRCAFAVLLAYCFLSVFSVNFMFLDSYAFVLRVMIPIVTLYIIHCGFAKKHRVYAPQVFFVGPITAQNILALKSCAYKSMPWRLAGLGQSVSMGRQGQKGVQQSVIWVFMPSVSTNIQHVLMGAVEKNSQDHHIFMPLNTFYALYAQRIFYAHVHTIAKEVKPDICVKFYHFTKRTFDVLLASALLIFFSPLLLCIALLIRIDSKGGAIYKQRRVGYGGKVFTVYKFRSMYEDAEKHGAVWACANDARITRVGRILRFIHADELPQLWNVLKNDMSFVGPRPERYEFEAELKENIVNYALRHKVKPGLTGLAQIRYPYGASYADTQQKLEYDVYYVQNASLLLDIQIMLQTVGAIVFPPRR